MILRHWTKSSFVLVMVYLRFGTNQFPQLIVNWTFRNKRQWNIKGNMKCFVTDWFEIIVSKCWPILFRPQYLVRILCCLGRLHVELSYLGICYNYIDHLYFLVIINFNKVIITQTCGYRCNIISLARVCLLQSCRDYYFYWKWKFIEQMLVLSM